MVWSDNGRRAGGTSRSLLGAKDERKVQVLIAVDARRDAHAHPCTPGGAAGANISATFEDNGANEKKEAWPFV